MITIKHFGFHHPPVGIIQMLKSLAFKSPTSILVADPFGKEQLPFSEIQSADKTNLFVVIYSHEGASHKWFDRLIPQLNKQCGVPLEQIILHSSCLQDPESPIQHVGSIVDYASDMVERFANWPEPKLEPAQHHFVCLNRLHRWQRLKLVCLLLDEQIDRFGKISYIDARHGLIPKQYHSRFPMTVDSDQVSISQGHMINPALAGAAINVITESCYEADPNGHHIETHHLPGLTEKTFKSIYLSQIPIFVAPFNTVKCFREIGFDAFDDIIDHSYDLEPDPQKRLIMIKDQIKNMCLYDLSDLDKIRNGLESRFRHNFLLLQKLANNHMAELPIWQKRLAKWLVDR